MTSSLFAVPTGAQVVVQNFDPPTAFGGGQIEYFNVDVSPAVFSSTFTGQEFDLNNDNMTARLEPQAVQSSQLTDVLSIGALVGAGSTFSTNDTGIPEGDHYVGFSVQENDGTHYGYIEFSVYGPPDNSFYDTIDTIAYNEVPGQGIVTGATTGAPEPSTLCLFGMAAAAFAGMALFRRGSFARASALGQSSLRP